MNLTSSCCFAAILNHRAFRTTRGDPEIRGKVRLNRIAFIDCNENSQT